MRRGKIGLALVVLLAMSVVASAQVLRVSLETDPWPVVAGIDSFFDVYVYVEVEGNPCGAGLESIDLSIVSINPAASAEAVEVVPTLDPPASVWEWNPAEMAGYIQIDPTWMDIGGDGDMDTRKAAAAAKVGNTNFTVGTDDGLSGAPDKDLIGIAGWICNGPPTTYLDVIVNRAYLYGPGGPGDIVIPVAIEVDGVPVNVPEPATLVVLGLSGLFLRRRK